ncbi:salt stress protein, Slr1339 family [Chroococcidiopsis sp. TS-821]|uniref:salt stress protein, Slr1339 family n=1 Tax=Chroococcidiopsis sp. TS-821 TaxID=1378066 RepID=UPI000CEEB5BF|nr:hypothetical protein [Chroococcidiopsis sp. TS-821]PPS44091.1 hypothetical protein B1A85_08950 [Chroococcidiopsis sp. TS-821]
MDELDKLLAQIDATPHRKIAPPANKSTKSTSDIEHILSEIKVDYAQKESELEQQKAKERYQRAIAWLKTLDPLSSEGLWFEQFAAKYPSKIAAAVDYLNLYM